jgi:hypothetical protein
MRDGINPLTGMPQSFYFPDDHPLYPGWFKGMEQIIRERGLWPANGLRCECPGFKCGGVQREGQPQPNCCCRRILFAQPDFTSQRPQLQEYIESRGHLCDFYPKYHCELNFIEQYWGAAKLRYRVAGRARTLDSMEQKMLKSLNDIPLEQIQRYVFSFLFFSGLKYLHRFADRSARFISAYRQGLSGAQAIWANQKYHGHRVLPPDMVSFVKNTVLQ